MKATDNQVIGMIITLDSPEIAEIISELGYDWVMIDMEHSTLDIKSTQRIIQVIGNKCKTIVRIPVNEDVWIKRILETGCDGIMIPLVNTAEEASKAINATK